MCVKKVHVYALSSTRNLTSKGTSSCTFTLAIRPTVFGLSLHEVEVVKTGLGRQRSEIHGRMDFDRVNVEGMGWMGNKTQKIF